MVVRFGNGFPIDSNVFRPITITWPVVIFLNHLKSSGKCHGIWFPRPITRFSDMAAMVLKRFTSRFRRTADVLALARGQCPQGYMALSHSRFQASSFAVG